MSSSDLELQKAIYERLKSYVPLQGLVGASVFDLPSASDTLPYVTIGEADLKRADVTCQQSDEIYLTLHAWSAKPGYTEVKSIAAAVVKALHHYPLLVVGYRLLSIDHTKTRTFRDRDGMTSHAAIEFTAYIEAL